MNGEKGSNTTPTNRVLMLRTTDAKEALAAAEELTRHYTGAENGVSEPNFAALRQHAQAFIASLLIGQPPSPERSTAIAKVREALSWGIAGLVMPRA